MALEPQIPYTPLGHPHTVKRATLNGRLRRGTLHVR